MTSLCFWLVWPSASEGREWFWGTQVWGSLLPEPCILVDWSAFLQGIIAWYIDPVMIRVANSKQLAAHPCLDRITNYPNNKDSVNTDHILLISSSRLYTYIHTWKEHGKSHKLKQNTWSTSLVKIWIGGPRPLLWGGGLDYDSGSQSAAPAVAVLTNKLFDEISSQEPCLLGASSWCRW